MNSNFELIQKTSPRFKGGAPDTIHKFRLAISQSKKSKAEGFRIYVAINPEKRYVAFLEIFTKKGADGLDDLKPNERNQMIFDYLQERRKGELKEHNLHDDFKLIE